MIRSFLPAPLLEDGHPAHPAGRANLRSVYAELSINFQYGARDGLTDARRTLEGY